MTTNTNTGKRRPVRRPRTSLVVTKTEVARMLCIHESRVAGWLEAHGVVPVHTSPGGRTSRWSRAAVLHAIDTHHLQHQHQHGEAS